MFPCLVIFGAKAAAQMAGFDNFHGGLDHTHHSLQWTNGAAPGYSKSPLYYVVFHLVCKANSHPKIILSQRKGTAQAHEKSVPVAPF